MSVQMPSFEAAPHPRWQQLMSHFVQNYQPNYNPQLATQPYMPQLAARTPGGYPEPQTSDNPPAGAEVPYEQQVLSHLNTVAAARGTMGLASAVGRGLMNAGEAGALFPKTAEELPIMQPGSKTGDPHALFAYNDTFGEGGAPRAIYNVYGDPAHPAIQTRGWGSSVPKGDLDQLGIPVVGRQPNAVGVQPAQ